MSSPIKIRRRRTQRRGRRNKIENNEADEYYEDAFVLPSSYSSSDNILIKEESGKSVEEEESSYSSYSKPIPKTEYTLFRKRNEFRTRYAFQLLKGEEIIFSCKGEGLPTNKLYIKMGKECSLKEPPFDYVITISGWNEKHYKLYKGSSKDTGVCLASVILKYFNDSTPRDLHFYFEDEVPAGLCREMNSKKPRKTKSGTWDLGTNYNIAISSIKNCIVECDDSKEAIIICKTSSDELYLATPLSIDPIYIMLFGVASFIG